jgi:DNA invertase Pin-like site-specific DNA recombinase
VSFQENISDAQSDRKQLARLLAMDHGATVIVTQRWIGWVCSIYSGSSTDRQGDRSPTQADTMTAAGRPMVTAPAGIAEFDRSLIAAERVTRSIKSRRNCH